MPTKHPRPTPESAAHTERHREQMGRAAAAALAEYFEGRPPGPVPRSVWLGKGYIEASRFQHQVMLAGIFVDIPERGAGVASNYLRNFLAVMDKHGAEVCLRPKAVGPQDPLTKMGFSDLSRWYKRHGFITKPGTGGKTLIRTARAPTPSQASEPSPAERFGF